jgi:hypothetical protein
MGKKAPDSQFDPPWLNQREAEVLRRALIRYAKDCDTRFRAAQNPQDAYSAAVAAECARELVERIGKAEQTQTQTQARSVNVPGLRPIR